MRAVVRDEPDTAVFAWPWRASSRASFSVSPAVSGMVDGGIYGAVPPTVVVEPSAHTTSPVRPTRCPSQAAASAPWA